MVLNSLGQKADGTVMKCGTGINVPLIAAAQAPKNLVKKEMSIFKESERAAGPVDNNVDNKVDLLRSSQRCRLVV